MNDLLTRFPTQESFAEWIDTVSKSEKETLLLEAGKEIDEIERSKLPFDPPTNDDELWEVVKEYVGIEIPRKAVCDGHSSPFQAFADSYFARSSVTVWKASRGFGGKSVLLATLSHTETMCLGASVNLLGGSGEQAGRVHSYITGHDTNLPDTFWEHPEAPRQLLKTDPTLRESRLTNGGRMKVLMASSRSVRGPHPQRLRIDEIDEVDDRIYQASMGQAMESRGIMEQTVLSSTHQHATGTMTKVLQQAGERGWPVYEWCYKESQGAWLDPAQVLRKRNDVTEEMWNVEYELQAPNPGARAISPDAVEKMFRKDLGNVPGTLGEYYEFEPPVGNARYAHGADWARKVDNTVIITYRVDISPMRVVAFERTNKEPWPIMVAKLDKRIKRYGGGEATHDATGLGDVITGYLISDVEPFLMSGRPRSELLNDYIVAVEQEQIVSPHIEFMYAEHKYASVDDVYSSGSTVHLPDSISAGALGYRAADRPIDWESVRDLGKQDDYKERSLWR